MQIGDVYMLIPTLYIFSEHAKSKEIFLDSSFSHSSKSSVNFTSKTCTKCIHFLYTTVSLAWAFIGSNQIF